MSQNTLPVDDVREDFNALFADASKPLILTAPTGSGKSTRLPIWMAEETGDKVLVVEPRRVACRSLATYLSKLAGQKPGGRFGYTIRFEDVRSAETEVVFVTPGVALRMLADEDFGFGSVMLDEFHERGWETDLLAAILRARRQRQDPGPLVLTSATLEAESLAASLDANLLEARGRTYPVDIEYLPQGAAMPTRHDVDDRVRGAIEYILASDDDGEVLVFLPGKGEIRDCMSALSAIERRHDAIEVMEVHASLPMHKLMRAFEDPTPSRRRIFLATNVAETSITLPGVTWVVDSGLVRMQLHRGGRTALALTPTSEASMDQRAGRPGRVGPGRCIRLWERNWMPQPTTSPEIERIELDDVLLRAAVCGLDGDAFEAAPWVTPPPEFSVVRAREELHRIRALDADGFITGRGRRLVDMPVSAHEARILLDPPEDLATAVADLVAIMQRGTRLLLSNPTRGVTEARKELFGGVRDEVTEALVALRRGDAHRHGLHGAALKETRKIATSLRSLLDLTPTSPTHSGESLPDTERLAAHVLERVPEMGFVLRERAQRRRGRSRSQPWANGELEVKVYPYEAHNEEDRPDADHEKPVAGALLDHTWLGDSKGYGVHGRGSMLLPCSLKTMARHVGGELEVGEPRIERRGGQTVVEAPVRRKRAGVTLTSRTEPLTGEALCEAVASLVFQNRLFKGIGPKIKDALHLWDLLHRWKPTLETEHWDLSGIEDRPAPAPEAYVAERLHTLGLRTSEELMLLEGEDLVPDVAQMSGIMEYELDRLRKDFPRIWEHLGAQYHCAVNPAAKKVTLTPHNRAAKNAGDPSSNVVPRFQNYRVVFKQASRMVTIRG